MNAVNWKRILDQKKTSLSNLSSYNEEFIKIMHSVFSISKCFGIATTSGHIGLSWFYFLSLLLITIESGTIWKLIKVIAGWAIFSTGNRSIMARLSGAIFYGNALMSIVLFWRLRPAWRRLHKEWFNAERNSGLYISPEKKLKRNMLVIVGMTIIFCYLEHGMSVASNTFMEWDKSISEIFAQYILNSHAFLIIPSDYSLPLGLILLLISEVATLLWNFQDMVIILMSLGLTSRYNRLNGYVKEIISSENISNYNSQHEDQNSAKSAQWRRVRVAYVRQAALVRKVNQVFGKLILLSCSNNFYFICLQVFHGVGGEHGTSINRVYYYISIVWLFVRAFAVVLAAAEVNVSSKRALIFIQDYPDKWYNVEVQRLEKQLSKDTVGLSALGLFYLERSLILQMVASLIKYELILLEFDK